VNFSESKFNSLLTLIDSPTLVHRTRRVGRPEGDTVDHFLLEELEMGFKTRYGL
jgi:hypothetical protein